jgi:hypothetical protein
MHIPACPTASSTVLFKILAVLYGPMTSLVLTDVLEKGKCTVRGSGTAARAIY